MSKRDPSEVAAIIQELSEPLAAIVSNAQAGQRIADASGVDLVIMEVLSDIVEDGKRAGELLRSLDASLSDR